MVEELAVDEGRGCADERHALGAFTARQRTWVASVSLNTIAG